MWQIVKIIKTQPIKIYGMQLKQHLQGHTAVQRGMETVFPLLPLTNKSLFVQLLETGLVLSLTLIVMKVWVEF